jgi:hypothetical protein
MRPNESVKHRQRKFIVRKLLNIIHFVGFEALRAVMKGFIYWGISDLLPTSHWFLAWLIYSSILNTEATCYFEMSVDFQLSTRRYIPEVKTLLNAFYTCKYH